MKYYFQNLLGLNKRNISKNVNIMKDLDVYLVMMIFLK